MKCLRVMAGPLAEGESGGEQGIYVMYLTHARAKGKLDFKPGICAFSAETHRDFKLGTCAISLGLDHDFKLGTCAWAQSLPARKDRSADVSNGHVSIRHGVSNGHMCLNDTPVSKGLSVSK